LPSLGWVGWEEEVVIIVELEEVVLENIELVMDADVLIPPTGLLPPPCVLSIFVRT